MSDALCDMPNRLNKVHVTYKHDKEYEADVKAMELGFLKNAIEYSIDKNDIGYRDSIVEYEKEIGESDRVVMFVTDGYLKSLACMFEMTRIFGDKNYLDKVFPVVHLKDISRDCAGLVEVKKYWTTELTRINASSDFCHDSIFIQSNIQKIRDVLKTLDTFWDYLVNVNSGEIDLLLTNDAELLMRELKDSMTEVYDNKTEQQEKSTQGWTKRAINQGDKGVYVENNTGVINIH